MIRFIHCADFHLDSPFAKERSAERSEKKRMMLSSFFDMISRIKSENIPLCLIAGDLFDSREPSDSVKSAVFSAFSNAPACRFFISPGNHDPYIPGGIWDSELPDNVHVFRSGTPTYVRLDDLNVTVHGWAVCEGTAPTDPLDGYTYPASDGIHIGAGHANLTGSEDGVYTLHESSIAGSRFAYLALGHIHMRSFSRISDTAYGYSGCACGRDFGECGPKGYLLCTYENGSIKTDFCPLNGQVYYRESIDITGCADNDEAAVRIRALTAGLGVREDDCLRLRLLGQTRSDMHIDIPLLCAMSGIKYIKIIDETVPTADMDALRADPGLRGEFFRALEGALTSTDPAEREKAALALKFGMCAMSGGDLDAIGREDTGEEAES